VANILYPKGKEAFLGGDLDWDAQTFKVVLLTSAYTYDAAHDNLDDIGGGARVATSSALANKTKTNGAADADDVVFTTPASGSTVTQFAIFKDSGTESTSTLVALFDTVTGLPLLTNGGNINLVWNASGIFSL
jgi:hypothetical protein